MRNVLWLCGVLLLVALPATAQSDYRHRLRFGAINEQISENQVDFHLTGFDVRYSYGLTRHVAVAGEYGHSFGKPFDLDSTRLWIVTGVQVYPYAGERAEIYGNILGGVDRLKMGEGPFSWDSSGAFKTGLGINLYPHPNFGFNIEVNYKRTWLFGEGQNTWQGAAGITIRWGER